MESDEVSHHQQKITIIAPQEPYKELLLYIWENYCRTYSGEDIASCSY